MNSIIVISKTNMTINQDYYSQIMTVECIQLKLNILMTILITIKKCLTLVTILLN